MAFKTFPSGLGIRRAACALGMLVSTGCLFKPAAVEPASGGVSIQTKKILLFPGSQKALWNRVQLRHEGRTLRLFSYFSESEIAWFEGSKMISRNGNILMLGKWVGPARIDLIRFDIAKMKASSTMIDLAPFGVDRNACLSNEQGDLAVRYGQKKLHFHFGH